MSAAEHISTDALRRRRTNGRPDAGICAAADAIDHYRSRLAEVEAEVSRKIDLHEQERVRRIAVEAERDLARDGAEALAQDLLTVKAERDYARAERDEARQVRNRAQAEVTRLREELGAAREQVMPLTADIGRLSADENPQDRDITDREWVCRADSLMFESCVGPILTTPFGHSRCGPPAPTPSTEATERPYLSNADFLAAVRKIEADHEARTKPAAPAVGWGSVPPGRYELFADDDDVIGLTVATTYPSGWPIVRIDPPFMDGCDEFAIGQFIAEALSRPAASSEGGEA